MVEGNSEEAVVQCWDTKVSRSEPSLPRTPSVSCLSNLKSTASDKYFTSLEFTQDELLLSDEVATRDSDFSECRPVWIVTTAALPWMTGTAVNPLLRAAYLANGKAERVHLVLPWLEREEDRVSLYGETWRHVSTEFQENYIQEWVAQNVAPNIQLHMHWYASRYHAKLGSIFAMGDVCATLSNIEPKAICILEEPEHLNYYRGGHWRTQFRHVCGVIHTNYCQYAEQKSALAAPLVGAVSAWMVRAYCDKVVHLSATLPKYAPEKEVVCNIHGVRRDFFQTFRPGSGTQIYYLGKLLWAKGLDKLLELQEFYKHHTGSYFAMDIFGSGPDETEIRDAFGRSAITTTSYYGRAAAYWIGENAPIEENVPSEPLPVTFPGRVDHVLLDENRNGCYKIFINPSVSEVLCTVTAEALAMGKFVIIPRHPSNTFFESFENCLVYRSSLEFCQQLQFALSNQPRELNSGSQLTWEAATERLMKAASITEREAARRDRLFVVRDQRLADWHIKIGQGKTGDVVRSVLGGGPVAKQASSCGSFSRSSSASTVRITGMCLVSMFVTPHTNLLQYVASPESFVDTIGPFV